MDSQTITTVDSTNAQHAYWLAPRCRKGELHEGCTANMCGCYCHPNGLIRAIGNEAAIIPAITAKIAHCDEEARYWNSEAVQFVWIGSQFARIASPQPPTNSATSQHSSPSANAWPASDRPASMARSHP